jgi:hypothetical protein
VELFGYPILNIALAITVGYFFWRTGFRILRGMAAPIPEPPPPGELRKVKIMYRCSICGAEVRMTVAPDQDPPPPRHCLEDMELVAPIDD